MLIHDEKTAEEQWAAHLMKCPVCPLYIEGKSHTLAHVCVIGAPLIKSVLEQRARPEITRHRKIEREMYKRQMDPDEKRVSRDRLKSVMRYKE